MNVVSRHHVVVPKTQYNNVKKRFKTDTYVSGAAVSSIYFLSSNPVTLGVSSLIGSVSSILYVHALSDYVDDIESRGSQFHLLIPAFMVIGEHVWNVNNPSFQLDFLTTMVGFFSYKLALTRVMYDTIKESLKS